MTGRWQTGLERRPGTPLNFQREAINGCQDELTPLFTPVLETTVSHHAPSVPMTIAGMVEGQPEVPEFTEINNPGDGLAGGAISNMQHKLHVIGPTEPWSVREKLCLATSVMKSGHQNWVSVSRAIKPFAEPGRPPDWFSQKHCASKYSELLEATDAPKRKRGEKGEVVETVEDVIVRRLTTDRIDELKKRIKETQDKHRKLKREAELIKAGHLDSKLEELWEGIRQKKRAEEEEAEWKRKNTDAAFQARKVAKGTTKRVPDVYSPSGGGSPSQEFSPGPPLESLTLDLGSIKNASGSSRFMTFSESSGLAIEDINQASLLDDLAQKKLLCQKATPPPSPLLSELLKKGNILASNSRLISDGDLSSGNLIAAHDLQLALPSQPLSQATGAPMLSRLLEAGPTQLSAPLSFMVGTNSVSSTPLTASSLLPVDSTASASTEDKVSGLCEEDETVSYMGDELDLKTVGDIIAIIEDKADEAADALDAAAVEAALSLCEENGHALVSGAWEAGPFQPHDSHHIVPTGVPQASSLLCSLGGKTDVSEVQDETSASLSSLCHSQNHCLAVFPMGLRRVPISCSSSFNSRGLEHCATGAAPRPEAMRETGKVMKAENGISFGRGENASSSRVDNEINGPEAGEEEEGDGVEGFVSEPDGDMDLEPAASESEDGYSLHTASSSLQLHTTADSIPSSPASSQFSVCSEDLEALQAHKIWKKAIMLVWRAAANHRYANVFLQPVTDDIAPGYHSIVQRPMDLATIKKNIENGLIRTTAEFQRDIMLMFQNAVMYNSMDHDVYHMALEMQRDVLEQIQQFLATQLIMETSEAGISAKSLRGRESTRKQDSTDKDAVSMSSPAFLLSLFDGGTRGRRCAIEADLKMKK
ncbi:bromodomain-containing protein 8-like [Limanda limanda]|uniref:bromodomain-containing protein 8-like n=1 Tax=Limanda limanda TaxID=27771 RepID=UPI0029C7E129|nr:bromodomain-containing protein 8-like [Limanda limanda]